MRRAEANYSTSRSTRRGAAPWLLAVAVGALFLIVSCADATAEPDAAAESSARPSVAPGETMAPETAPLVVGPDASAEGPCRQVDLVREGVLSLTEVELRIANRVALEIELGKVQAAYAELSRADLGALEVQLEDPLRRLGYRLVDLEIAVEDFRTNSRPKPAAAHVETDARSFGDAVAGFAILARC